MADYIERGALLKELQEEIDFESTMYTEEQNKWFAIGLKCAYRDVKSQPIADVVPRDEVQEIFKEFDRMLERYAYEPYYTVQDMEIEVNILKEKYTKGGEQK